MKYVTYFCLCAIGNMVSAKFFGVNSFSYYVCILPICHIAMPLAARIEGE